MKIVKLKIENYIGLQTIFILVAILASFAVYLPSARAGLIIKLPSSLGLSTDLEAHWTFDGDDIYSTTAIDRSGQGNNGTITGGGPVAISGKLGQAMNFDGVNDKVSVNGPALTTTYSISFWFVAKTGGTWQNIIKMSDGAPHNGIFFKAGSQRLSFYNDSDNLNNTNLTLGNWYHVVFVSDGGNATWYIDGVADGTTTSPSWTVRQIGDNSFSEPLNSPLDDLRVYSRALSLSEINRLYNMGTGLKIGASQSDKITSGLVGYWSFDGTDTIGTTVLDKSGNGNNGALTDGAKVGTGKIGQGLEVDGTNDFVNIPSGDGSSLDVTGAEVSVSLWANSDTIGWDHTLDRYPCYYLDLLASGVYSFRVTDQNDASGHVDGSTVVNRGQWYHVVGVKTPTHIIVYVNGVEDGRKSYVADLDASCTLTKIGKFQSANFEFDGKLDEVRVYNRALSEGEIKSLYNQGAALKVGETQDDKLTSGLIGYWPFNGKDIYGTTAIDRSGNGSNGTFINGPRRVPGKLGQALEFDGVDDYVSIPDAASIRDLPETALTFAAWVETSNIQNQSIFTKGTGSNKGWHVIADNFGRLQFAIQRATTDLSVLSDTLQFSLGGWVHMAVTYPGGDTASDVKMYVNGSEVSGYNTQTDGAGAYQSESGLEGRIARTAFNGFQQAYIDEVRIYSRALSADEIKRLYEMGR